MIRSAPNQVALALFLATALLSGCSRGSADEVLASAKSYLDRKDERAAVIELKNALQLKPDLAEARFLLGKTLLQAEDPKGAYVELGKALELRYPDPNLVPMLAQAYLEAGEPQKAIDLAQTQSLETAAAAALWTTIAKAQRTLSQFSKADAAIARALEFKPDHAPALLLRAQAIAVSGDVDGAVNAIDAILAKQADYVEAITAKADVVHFGRKDGPGSVALYRKALELRPNYAPAHSGLISEALERSDLEAAQSLLDALKKARPGIALITYFDARIALAKDDLKRANELGQQLAKNAPEDPDVLRLTGALALRRGELLVADQQLSKLVKAYPRDDSARRLLAMVRLKAGDAAGALEVLDPLLRLPNPDAATLTLAGHASMASGDMKQAEGLLERAAKMAPSDSAAKVGLAAAKVQQGRAPITDLEQLAQSERGNAADLASISWYINNGKLDGALAAIDRLEKKQPAAASVHWLRARVLVMRGDSTGARRAYEKALSLDANYFPAIEGLAVLDVRERNPDQARKRLEAVLQASPEHVGALAALAVLSEQQGRPGSEVAALLAKAVSARPSDVRLRRQLVQFYLRHHDEKQALVEAQKAASALPDDPLVLETLASAQLAAGETNQALASYGKLVAARPKSEQPLLALVDAQIQLKMFDEAAATLARARSVAPNSPAVAQRAIRMLILQERYDGALDEARRLQTQQPKAAAGFALEGEVHRVRENWAAAASAYRAALSRSPESPGALAVMLYRSLNAAKDQRAADAFASEWIASHPKDDLFVFALANVATAEAKFDVAEKRLQQVLAISPQSPSALNNLAWVQLQLGRPEALENARLANQLAPNRPENMDTLAAVLAKQGNMKEAIELQQKAVNQWPGAAEYRWRLAQLQMQAGNSVAARKELETLSALGDKFPRQDEVKKALAALK